MTGFLDKLNKGLENVITIASGEAPPNSYGRPDSQRRRGQQNIHAVKRGGVADDLSHNKMSPSSNAYTGNIQGRKIPPPPPPSNKHSTSTDRGAVGDNSRKMATQAFASKSDRSIQSFYQHKQPVHDQVERTMPPNYVSNRVPTASKIKTGKKYSQQFQNRSSYEYDDGRGIVSKFFSSLPSPSMLVPSFLKTGRNDYERGYLSLSKISSKADGWDINEDDNSSSSILSKLMPFCKKKSTKSSSPQRKPYAVSRESDVIDPFVNQLLQKNKSLLSIEAEKRCRTYGNIRAAMDIVAFSFAFASCSQLMTYLSSRLTEFSSEPFNFYDIANPIIKAIRESLDSWAPINFGVFILMIFTNHIIFFPKIRRLAIDESSSIYSAASYSQLWLRILGLTTVDESLNELIANQAGKEVYQSIAIRRIFVFVAVVLLSMAVVTISVIRPLLQAIVSGFIRVPQLRSLRVWPISSHDLIVDLHRIWLPVWITLQSLINDQVVAILERPFEIVAPTCLYLVLLAATCMPSVERKITHLVSAKPIPEDVSVDELEPVLSAETLTAIGSSSANRLQVQSHASSSAILDRWRLMQPVTDTRLWQRLNRYHSQRIMLRKLFYMVISTGALSIPFIVNFYLPSSSVISSKGKTKVSYSNLCFQCEI